MNKSDFIETDGFWEAIVDGIEISISEDIMSDAVLQFTEKILQAYPKKIVAMAEHISRDKMIVTNYNLSKEDIANKLNKPNILIGENCGKLSYYDNEIDHEHILEIEFEGVLEEFHEVSMDC